MSGLQREGKSVFSATIFLHEYATVKQVDCRVLSVVKMAFFTTEDAESTEGFWCQV
jgi:hypothetical protein